MITIDEIADFYRSVLGGAMPATTPAMTHVELKSLFDIHSEMHILDLWASSLTEAYHTLLEQKPLLKCPDGRYQIYFCPSKKFVEGKYRYIVGADPHLYGWNLVGRIVEDVWYGWNPEYAPFFLYACHHATIYLFRQMESGISIAPHVGKTPFEILSSCDMEYPSPIRIREIVDKWTAGTLAYSDLIRLEFRYPRNLALFVFRRGASTFFLDQDSHFKNQLLSFSLRFLEAREEKTVDPCLFSTDLDDKKKDWIRRLENLFLVDKLPLPSSHIASLKRMRRQQWNPEEIRQHEALRPNGSWSCSRDAMGILADPKKAILILSEDNDAMSPLFPHGDLRYQDKIFPTIFHLTTNLLMQKLGLPLETAYDKIHKKDVGFIDFYQCSLDNDIDALWKKRMRIYFLQWMKTKMQQKPLWIRRLLLSQNVNDVHASLSTHEFIYHQMSKFVVNCHRRMQLQDKNRFERWTYLQSFDPDNDPVLHERLERFLIHFLHTLRVANEDLGIDIHDLRIVKKIFRIVYPSLWVLFSSLDSGAPDRSLPLSASLQIPEIDAFLGRMLATLACAWKTHGGSAIGAGGGGLLKPKCIKETVRKVCLLYQISNKKDTPGAIESILSGCCTWNDDNILPFPRVATSLFLEYPGTKNADKTVKHNLGRVVMALHRNRAYQQF